MIAQQKTHTLVRSHDFEESEFGINPEDVSHVIHLLRNQIYSNKTLAVIREYTTNAVDAHVESGKPNLPIQVTLPTKFEPTFKVRDFGSGLNHEEIKNLYTRYCKSTKRQSNSFTGQLGIGCKAGFAYGDSFGIVSYCNGIKNTYNAQVDESSKGKAILLDSSSTTEPNGMEIVISVADADVNTFRNLSLKLFRYFKVKPEIKNLGEDSIEEKSVVLSGDFWKLYDDGSGSAHHYYVRYNPFYGNTIAVMGNIGYPIDVANVQDVPSEIRDLFSLGNLHIEFDIGELDIAPSREALEYTKITQRAIIQKIQLVKADLEKIASEKLDGSADLWEAKCNYASIVNSLPYNIAEVLKNSFVWNGTKIDSATIGKPNTDWQDPEVIIRTYWKEDDASNTDGFKVKSRSVDRQATCHKTNLLAINDCTSNHGLALKARTLFKKNPDLKNIFMYWFKDSSWRDKMNDEHDFDKIDEKNITYFSEVEKSASGYVSSGGTRKSSAGSRQHVKVFKLKQEGYSQNDQDNWLDVEKDDTPTQGVYVPILRYGIVNGKSAKEFYNTEVIARLLNFVKKVSGIATEVYGVRVRDVDSLDDGDWTHFKVWLKKNINKILTTETWNKYVNDKAKQEIYQINMFHCQNFVNEADSIIEDNIIKKALDFLPNVSDGKLDQAVTKPTNDVNILLNTLLYIDEEEYDTFKLIQAGANVEPEITAEQVREALKEYPMLEAIEWYNWRFCKSDAQRAVQYINDIDELNRLRKLFS